MAKKKFYAVSVGRKKGIFGNWADCEKQVKGFQNAKFKGFATLQEAQNFLGVTSSHSDQDGESQINTAQTEQRQQQPASHASESLKTNTTTIPKKRPADDMNSASLETTTTTAKKRPHVAEKVTFLHPDEIPSNWSVMLCFDGGSRGNPGLAGSGVEVLVVQRTLKNTQKVRRKLQIRKYLGAPFTCNRAEWTGAVTGMAQLLNEVKEFHESHGLKPRVDLVVQGDSQLVIRQLKGVYKVKKDDLRKVKQEFDGLLEQLKKGVSKLKISYEHVLRDQNTVADRLANEAMDAKKSWKTIEEDKDEGGDSDSSSCEDQRMVQYEL